MTKTGHQIDVDMQCRKLLPAAQELAKRLGHAAVIAKNATGYFVYDSWQPMPKNSRAVRFVSVNGNMTGAQ